MDIRLTNISDGDVDRLGHLLSRGGFELRRQGLAIQAICPGSVLAEILIEKGSLAERLIAEIESQKAAHAGLATDAVSGAPATAEVIPIRARA